MSDSPILPPADRAGNGRAEGERRRDRAHTLLHARRAALVRRVCRTFLRHLLDHGPSTIDPVRAVVIPPADADPRFVGAAVRLLAEDRLIRSVGRERSTRPEAHARKVDVWAVTDPAAALDWLRCHPPLPGDEQLTLFPDC